MAQMVLHQAGRLLRLTLLDGAHDVLMLLVGADRAVLRAVLRDDQAGQCHQTAQVVGKQAVAGGLGQPQMKLARQLGQGRAVAA